MSPAGRPNPAGALKRVVRRPDDSILLAISISLLRSSSNAALSAFVFPIAPKLRFGSLDQFSMFLPL
jgi:hypothetical protein